MHRPIATVVTLLASLVPGAALAKDCNIGKPCGDTCIELADECHVDPGGVESYYSDVNPKPNIDALAQTIRAFDDARAKQGSTSADSGLATSNSMLYNSNSYAYLPPAYLEAVERDSRVLALVERGDEAVGRADYSGARDLYREAYAVSLGRVVGGYELTLSSRAIFGYAVAMDALGHHEDAQVSYINVLALNDGGSGYPPVTTSDQRAILSAVKTAASGAVMWNPSPSVSPRRVCNTFAVPRGKRASVIAKKELFYPTLVYRGWVWGARAPGAHIDGEWVKATCLYAGMSTRPALVEVEDQ